MALSTVQLESLLRRNPITKRYFIGVYPSCIYPRSRKKMYCFITNTDDHEEGGEHWNGFFVRDKTLYFFDSFGRSPNDDTLPHSYRDIVLRFKNVKYFPHCLQSFDSFTCGYYCIHFLLLFSMGLDFQSLMNEYSFDTQGNDLHVLNVIKSII